MNALKNRGVGLNVNKNARHKMQQNNVCLHFARDALHVRLARRCPGLFFSQRPPTLLLFIGV